MAVESQDSTKSSFKTSFIRALHLGPKREQQTSVPASPQQPPQQQKPKPRPGPTRLVKKQKSKSNLSSAKSQDPLPPLPSVTGYGNRPTSRPSSSSRQSRNNAPPREFQTPPPLPITLEAHRQKYAQTHHRRNFDAQLGETRLDDTTLLHSLAKQGSFDSLNDHYQNHHLDHDHSSNGDPSRPPGELFVQSLPPALWTLIASYLTPLDAATLAYSSPTFLSLLGPEPFRTLNAPLHRVAKIHFLKRIDLDRKLPLHLLCYPCARFHLRAAFAPGAEGSGNGRSAKEGLKMKGTPNLIYDSKACRRPERNRALDVRLTPKLALPFALAMLAVRGEWYGDPRFGLDVDGRSRGLESLARRWNEGAGAGAGGLEGIGRGWRHELRFHLHYPSPSPSSSSSAKPHPKSPTATSNPAKPTKPKPHLLLRLTSSHPLPASLAIHHQPLPPSAIRLLLFEREDYTPYFSVCAHWRQGLLVQIVKCALGHVASGSSSSSAFSSGGSTSAAAGSKLTHNQAQHSPKELAKNMYARMNAGLGAAGIGLNPGNSSSSGAGDIVGLCGFCKPMRRCTECASEYLVEIRLVEDRERLSAARPGSRSAGGGLAAAAMSGFKLSLVVTRWSDLGACDIDPSGVAEGVGEWSAVVGVDGSVAGGGAAAAATSSAAAEAETRTGTGTASVNLAPAVDITAATTSSSSSFQPSTTTSNPNTIPSNTSNTSNNDESQHRIRSGFNSFSAIGNRALAGWFEASRAADGVEALVPGQRVLSLDPGVRSVGRGVRMGGRRMANGGMGGRGGGGNGGGRGRGTSGRTAGERARREEEEYVQRGEEDDDEDDEEDGNECEVTTEKKKGEEEEWEDDGWGI